MKIMNNLLFRNAKIVIFIRLILGNLKHIYVTANGKNWVVCIFSGYYA